MSSVQFEDVSKQFYDVVAVDGLNLEIANGELFVILGPSGSGKTTTLRLLAGLETLTRGTLRIGDRQVNDLPPRQRNLAMVFQDRSLYPHLDVYGNFAFGLKLRGQSKAKVDKRIREAANLLGVEHLLSRKPAELSGGEQQRIAVGRAIVREPEVFLLDEPLSNLDARLRDAMRWELLRLQQRLGATMIYVTHDQVEAMLLGSRLAVLDRGRLQQVGTPIEVYERPSSRFVAQFVGSPTMNLLRGVVERQDGGLAFRSDALSIAAPAERWHSSPPTSRPLWLGVRPHDLRLGSHGETTLSGVVEHTQCLGNETHVAFNVSGKRLTIVVPADCSLTRGDQFEFSLDLQRVHLFDGQTERRLS